MRFSEVIAHPWSHWQAFAEKEGRSQKQVGEFRGLQIEE
jgi:hypothetical protein